MDIKYTQKQFDNILELERRGELDDYPNSQAWLKETRRLGTKVPYKVPSGYHLRNDMAQGKVGLLERTLEPFHRGLKQPFKGMIQLSTNAQAAMGMVPQEQADKMNREVTAEKKLYEPLLQESGLAQTADIAGNILGELPMLALPATKYPKAVSALAGGLTGLTQPTEVEEGDSYAMNKAGQTAIGTGFGFGFGAAFHYAGPKVKYAYDKLHKWIKSNKGVAHFDDYVKGGDFTHAGKEYFKGEGVPIDDMTADIRKKFATDLQEALKAGDSGLDGESLMRYLRAKKINVDLTLGQATKDTVHQSTELAGLADPTQKHALLGRKMEQNKGITETLENLQSRSGVPSTMTAEEVGKSTTNAMTRQASDLQKPVEKLYKIVDAGDGKVAMSPGKLFDKIFKIEESGRHINIKGFKGLRAELEYIMKEAAERDPGRYGSGKISAKTYEEMHKKISAMAKQASDRGDANSAKAFGELLSTRTDDYTAQFGYDVYKKPRDLAAHRFDSYGTKAMKDIVDTSKHQHRSESVYKAIKGSTNEELRKMKRFLIKGSKKSIDRGRAAWNKYAGHELTQLIDSSFEPIGEEGGKRIFSISKFKKTLKGYRDSGRDKILWGPEIRKELALVEKVGEDRVYNKSIMGSQGSPTAMLNYEMLTRGHVGPLGKLVTLTTKLIPGVGSVVRNATEEVAERSRVKVLGKKVSQHLDPSKFEKAGAGEIKEAELLMLEKLIRKFRSSPGVIGGEYSK